MKKFPLVAAALLAAAMISACSGPEGTDTQITNTVRTDSGLISGVPEAMDGIRVFKGIPFAAPPVADLRWKAPQPVAKWDGTRKADSFSNVCMQPPGHGRLNITVDVPGSPPTSEDCLYLNVWTGAKSASEKRPVMVWIHGGAYSEGGGSTGLYDGTNLAKKGAVVVTVNYRLGPFGFFAHPALTEEAPYHASGNYGFLDMLASLRWVQNNIAAFGGDPDNVTVFGQSAGAAAIATLVGSPQSEGLFKRAISESGTWMGLGVAKMAQMDQAEATGVKLAEKAGATSLADLRAMSADDVQTKLRGPGLGGGPVVDGYLFPQDDSETFAQGKQNAVDVLVGSNDEEGSWLPFAPKPDQYVAQAKQRWGDLADAYLKEFPGATNEQAAKSNQASFSEEMAFSMRLYAQYQAKLGEKAYVYHFTFHPPYEPGRKDYGPTHSAEIPYVLGNLGKAHLYPDLSSPELSAQSEEGQALATKMASYWFNFASTGDPNGPGLPEWPAYTDLKTGRAMILGKEIMPEAEPDHAKLDLYDALYHRDVLGDAPNE